MAGIYGVIGVADGDTSYVNQVGQRTVFDAAQAVYDAHTEEMERMYAIFFESDTEAFKERYYLPGGGTLQKRGGMAQSAAVKAAASWDVAYPLEDFGAQIAFTDIAVAKMRLPMLQRHIDSVTILDVNTMRREILRALFNSNPRTFEDEENGTLTLVPLANGDGVLYPPLPGTTTDTTDNHYLESGYAASAISDTNNPFVTLRDEIDEHFGTGDVAVFINPAQSAKTKALTEFDPVNDRYTRPGGNADVITDVPTTPGTVIGRTDGVWVVEWRWIPANYMLAVDLGMGGPLKKRLDPAEQGIESGLQLVSKEMHYPFEQSHYRNRYGVGVGNRLAAAVMELGTGGTYTIPTAYA